jgi:maltooligosyltrehalose trehalohydrolase
VTPSYPSFGALPQGNGVRFLVWAPEARRVDVVLEPEGRVRAMAGPDRGCFELFLPGIHAGALYRYRVDGGSTYPDPASRFQPRGVHGPSMVVDPRAYEWHDAGWTAPRPEDLVFYELHVGAFTPQGTFAGIRDHLSYLRDVGVTAVELMPVAEFPGRWNWGYDGAAVFAPTRAYGTPDDLRALVDDAHRLGLAVFLDVVYNHFGPEGAYAPALSPRFFSHTHRTPWGPAINFDGEGADGVRAFFIENALSWLVEYHLDGLRLDATHAIRDESPTHFLQELAEAVGALGGRKRYLIAEDHRNLNHLLLPVARGGYGLDGVWSDDYHHQLRRILAGDRDGYFEDFTDLTRDLATTIRQGWLFAGRYANYFGEVRGTDPTGIPLSRFVHFLQNHDQVGNRPQGGRITDAVSWAAYRAASALLLFAPEPPLIFMGQEWGARTPFCYFTDHGPALGQRVREGRQKEFQRFAGFRDGIPDPQSPATFERSRLDWSEQRRAPHGGILRLYRDLLALRRGLGGEFSSESPVDGGLILRRGRCVLLVALRDGLTLPLPAHAERVWDTEQPRYADDPNPPRVSNGAITCERAAAVLVRIPSDPGAGRDEGELPDSVRQGTFHARHQGGI